METRARAETSSSFARQVVARLSSRLENEKRELVLFLIELAELDAKKLALELGYPSTLGCLVAELGLTESSACRRIAAARLVARFPAVARHLLSNRLTLTGLVVLKDVLDESNVDQVLERAAGLSETEVRELVMRIRLGDAVASPRPEIALGQVALATAPAAGAAADRVATSDEVERASEAARPVEEREAVTLWVGRELREELAAVRSLVSHAVPSGKIEEVLVHVLRAQRKVLERRRYGSPKRGNVSAASADTLENARHVPAQVRREVYDRERGSCAYVGEGGRRCGSTVRLEYQHLVPVACGGQSTPENVTLFCRAHNQLQAEKDFGAEHIKARREGARLRDQAISVLKNLGYARDDAKEAVGAAAGKLPRTATLAALVKVSLAQALSLREARRARFLADWMEARAQP